MNDTIRQLLERILAKTPENDCRYSPRCSGPRKRDWCRVCLIRRDAVAALDLLDKAEREVLPRGELGCNPGATRYYSDYRLVPDPAPATPTKGNTP